MKQLIPNLTTEILITRKCNMNCTYCFERSKCGKEPSLEEVLKLLKNNGKNYNLPFEKFYMFGGEPCLNIEFITNTVDAIMADETLSTEQKHGLISSAVSGLTTNGTLLDKVMPLLKKYNFTLQVSLDGPEDINDLCRVDYNNKGHFAQIMENLKLCRENGVEYLLHGAIDSKNYKHFCRINEWYLEEQLLSKPDYPLKDILYNNYCQLVFESDIKDEEINELLEQYEKTIEMIFTTPVLKNYSDEDRKLCAEGFLKRKGGMCSAANNMFCLDDEMYLYPCHRLITSGFDKDHNLAFTNMRSDEETYNYKLYETFLDLPLRGTMYGPCYVNNTNDPKNRQFQVMWCPSTNWEETGSVFVMPTPYNVMVAELQNFIPKLANYYGLNINE